MDVQLEKKNLISRIESVDDESLILAVKNLLDYALGKEEDQKLLNESIERGLKDLKEGRVFTHKEVMDEARAKYGL